jgi:hypothetical protein
VALAATPDFAPGSDGDLVDAAVARLTARPTLLVLDDIEQLDVRDLPFLATLRALAAQLRINLLLIGRLQPAESAWPALPGLCEREARMLWEEATPLPAEQWRQLYAATAGMPQPLRIVAAAYRRAGSDARPHDWGATVAAWAHGTIWSRLLPDERRLLMGLILGPPAAQAHPAALCRTLGIAGNAIDRLRRAGLLPPAGADVRLREALRPCAAQMLRSEPALRARLQRLAAAPAFDTIEEPGIMEQMQDVRHYTRQDHLLQMANTIVET